MNNKVIYTAIFGKYDKLKKPKVIPEGFDFICFTDQDLENKTWQIRKVEKEFEDPTRCARQIKVRPHKYLSEYEYSIWTDGNIAVNGDMNTLLDKYLQDYDMAAFDHVCNYPDSRDCIYQEAKAILENNKYNYKDKEEVIKQQIEKYKKIGYPEHRGLIASGVLIRKHNDSKLIKVMEDWWCEIKEHSRRDQLSFNYVVWKNNFDFNLIKENIYKFRFFLYTSHKNKKIIFRIIKKIKRSCVYKK